MQGIGEGRESADKRNNKERKNVKGKKKMEERIGHSHLVIQDSFCGQKHSEFELPYNLFKGPSGF